MADAAERAMRQTSNRLADTLGRIAKSARQKPARGFIVPVVAANPSSDEATNLWLLADGRLRTRTPDGVIHEYAPITPTSPAGSTVALPADPFPVRYTKTYPATWAQTYCDIHGQEAGLYFGTQPGPHGDRRIMFGFDATQIASDLDSASVRIVELRGVTADAWADTVEIHFGTHTQATAPAGFSANRIDAYVGNWPRAGWGGGTDGWRTVSPSIGEWFQSGAIKGLTIDQPATVAAAGQFADSTLQLRVTYVL